MGNYLKLNDVVNPAKGSTILFISGGKDSVLSYFLAKEHGYKIDYLICQTFKGKVYNPTPLSKTDGDIDPDPSWTCEENLGETQEEFTDRILKKYNVAIAITGNSEPQPGYYREYRKNNVKFVSPVIGLSADVVIKMLAERGVYFKMATGTHKDTALSESLLKTTPIDFKSAHSVAVTKVVYGDD